MDIPQWRAIANLISAAPEMLEALENLIDFSSQRIPDEFTKELQRLCDKGYKAVAKATGRDKKGR